MMGLRWSQQEKETYMGRRTLLRNPVPMREGGTRMPAPDSTHL